MGGEVEEIGTQEGESGWQGSELECVVSRVLVEECGPWVVGRKPGVQRQHEKDRREDARKRS